jgi:hypothetical protein
MVVDHASLGESLEMTMIRAKHLTTFSVAPDGSSVAIGVADEEGQAAALTLPAECLRALIMTLPDMMRRALRLQHGDPSLRLVYPIAGWEIECGTRPEIRIVTLRTSDGFHVSFAMTTKDLREMSEAVAERMLH